MGYDLESKAFPALSEDEQQNLLGRIMRNAVSRFPFDPIKAIQAMWDGYAETGRYFRFNIVAFPKLVELAERHGWRPAKRLFPDADDFRYVGCGEVSAEDARSFADALERALDALNDVEPMQPPYGETEVIPGTGIMGIGPRGDLSPEAFWSGRAAKEKIRRFIQFARHGAFTIS
ncbi:MAG: hypothetical protein GWN84_07680 [Gammaproteobacteria bacterium]|nr:hypothetical protein [Gammaproteobacteria bacterium]NIR82762.1 hypothetical protein [Gammaproteobacteria bacterium]NIR89626.1 hypothetical protein [Gammaproteobacteria bacterium]NIU03922.1 hypothetical protein [Gammaproteobacteria bacterium]NIV51238.1 hypothetical protein [Gammaproteobacteria bacterium]